MTDPRDESTAPKPAADAKRHARSGAEGELRADAHAVVIGINKYKDSRIPNLRFARADAEAVYNVLTDPHVGRFKPENVSLLLDKEATERKIRSALGTNLPRRAPQESTVCIYYAGHGAPQPDTRPGRGSADGMEKYLVPHDAVADDLRSSGISMDAIQQYFSYLDANQIVCFLDCCYSGAAGGRSFKQDGFQVRAILSDDFLDGLASEGRLVVTACCASEVSLESPAIGHGVFTHRLVEGLQGKADTDGDGLVTVDELYDYVYRKVEADARTLGGSMRPIRRGSVRGRVYLTQYETDKQKRVRLLSYEASASWVRGEVDVAERAWTAILALDDTHESALDGLSRVAGRRAEEQTALERKHLLLLDLFDRDQLSAREYQRALKLLDDELTATIADLDRRRLKFLNNLLAGELNPKAYSQSMAALDHQIALADAGRITPPVSAPTTIPKTLAEAGVPEPPKSPPVDKSEKAESPATSSAVQGEVPARQAAATGEPQIEKPFGGADRVSYSHDGSALLRVAGDTKFGIVVERELNLPVAFVDRIVDDLYAALPDGLEERSTRAYRYLVHKDLKDKLTRSDEPLVVEVDRTMARVPWEMIAEGPGIDPIGLKRRVARQLRTAYSPPISDRAARRTLRALVIGDPDDSLPSARKEARVIHDLLTKLKKVDVEFRLGSPDVLAFHEPGVKPADFVETMMLLLDGGFDFVHFVGRAVFDPDLPDRSGWLFADGEVLTPSKLANITHVPFADVPRLIFANASVSLGQSSSKATTPKGGEPSPSALVNYLKQRPDAQGDLVASLADEFFRRGVSDYIGTAWQVSEGPAELFAVTFYESLLANQSPPVPLGKAMLAARAALREARVNWPAELHSTWAAYQHYGDPTRALADWRRPRRSRSGRPTARPRKRPRAAAGDATKKAAKKATAPDAVDLNTATEEQLKKVGLDEETTKKVVAARPFTNLEDPKLKEAIPADVLTKLEGKINVKPPAK